MTMIFKRAAETVELTTRRAPVTTNSYNPDTREFEVTFATPNAGVRRWDLDGEYTEILDIGGMRLRNGVVPFLDNHRRGSLDDQLGGIMSTSVVAGTARAIVRLSRHHPLAERLGNDLSDGMRFGVSVGYTVDTWRIEKNPTTGIRTKTATKWTVQEVSVVPVPADHLATTRSDMEPTTTPAPAPENPAPAPATPQTPAADGAGAVNTRAQVNGEIRTLGRATGAAASVIDGLIDRQASLDEARRAFLDAIVARSAGAPNTTPLAQLGEDHTSPIAIRAAMGDALAYRLAPHRLKLEGRAREFASYRLLDMAGDLAVARGDRGFNLRDQNALIERAVGAHSTSDFPLLVADAANKALLANYQAAEPTYRKWAARRIFADFKDHNFLRVGDFPEFKDINEGGETRYGTLSENRERVRASELSTGIAIGRRLLINDDLSALQDFSSMIAVRAAADENKRVYALLTGAPVLSDTLALFHATHGNLAGSGTAVDMGIDAAFGAIRKQQGLDKIPLNIQPKYLIIGPDREATARRILAAIMAAKASDVNPWSGSLELVVDANITGNAWYIAADPGAVPSIVYGYVSGAEGPQVRSEVDFDTRALKVAAGLDFGAGVIDFRGIYKNPGA